MKKKSLLAGVLAVVMALLGGCVSSQTGRSIPTEEKEVVEGSGSMVSYTFEDAVYTADTIVYGTVGERGETKVREGTEGESAIDFYREIPITIKKLVKGEGSGTVTYKEYGGETEDTVYIVRDFKPVEVGKDYILFLHDDGFPLPPETLIPIEDGKVSTSLLPNSMKEELLQEQGENIEDYSNMDINDVPVTNAMTIEEYVELIQENLK